MILLLLSPLVLQIPAAPAEASAPTLDPARARYEAAAGRWRKAAAVHAAFDLVMPGPRDEGEEAAPREVNFEVRLAKPLHGWVRIRDKEMGLLEWVADGRKVYQLDHEGKEYLEVGERLRDLPGLPLLPLEVWSNPKAKEPRSVELLPADPERTGATGLKLAFADATWTVWLDAQQRPLAATVRGTADAGETRLVVTRWEMPEKAKPEEWAGKVPEGYVLAKDDDDPAGKLLAEDTPAPEVTLTGMDDKPFQLSSLRGKAVLLNFWFYH